MTARAYTFTATATPSLVFTSPREWCELAVAADSATPVFLGFAAEELGLADAGVPNKGLSVPPITGASRYGLALRLMVPPLSRIYLMADGSVVCGMLLNSIPQPGRPLVRPAPLPSPAVVYANVGSDVRLLSQARYWRYVTFLPTVAGATVFFGFSQEDVTGNRGLPTQVATNNVVQRPVKLHLPPGAELWATSATSTAYASVAAAVL